MDQRGFDFKLFTGWHYLGLGSAMDDSSKQQGFSCCFSEAHSHRLNTLKRQGRHCNIQFSVLVKELIPIMSQGMAIISFSCVALPDSLIKTLVSVPSALIPTS